MKALSHRQLLRYNLMRTSGNDFFIRCCMTPMLCLFSSIVLSQSLSVYDLNQVKSTSYQIFVDKETGIVYRTDEADSLSKVIPLNLFSVQVLNDTAVFQITLGEINSEKDVSEHINQPLEFSIVDLSGKEYSSKDLKGKVVVFNFWFTSCRPCIEEMPILNEIVEKYSGSAVVFLALSYEAPDNLKKFLLKRPFYYSVVPNSSELIQKLNIRSFPTHLIMDKTGIIRYIEEGFTKDQKTGEPIIKSQLDNQINRYL